MQISQIDGSTIQDLKQQFDTAINHGQLVAPVSRKAEELIQKHGYLFERPNRTKSITVRLSERELEAFNQTAELLNTKLATLIRDFLTNKAMEVL